MKTQKQRVHYWLKEHNGITSLEAIQKLGITRLAAIIHLLKNDGIGIDVKMIEVRNRFNEKVKVAQYSLAEKKGQQNLWGE